MKMHCITHTRLLLADAFCRHVDDFWYAGAFGDMRPLSEQAPALGRGRRAIIHQGFVSRFAMYNPRDVLSCQGAPTC